MATGRAIAVARLLSRRPLLLRRFRHRASLQYVADRSRGVAPFPVPALVPALQRLRHQDEVGGSPKTGILKRFDAPFGKTEPAIERHQLRAQVDDAYVQSVTTHGTKVQLNRADHPAAESAPLRRSVDRQEAERATVATLLHVHASYERSDRRLAHEKRALRQQLAHAPLIDPIAIEEDPLRGEGAVDQADDGLNVIYRRDPN
jgi:hypothetical protein